MRVRQTGWGGGEHAGAGGGRGGGLKHPSCLWPSVVDPSQPHAVPRRQLSVWIPHSTGCTALPPTSGRRLPAHNTLPRTSQGQQVCGSVLDGGQAGLLRAAGDAREGNSRAVGTGHCVGALRHQRGIGCLRDAPPHRGSILRWWWEGVGRWGGWWEGAAVCGGGRAAPPAAAQTGAGACRPSAGRRRVGPAPGSFPRLEALGHPQGCNTRPQFTCWSVLQWAEPASSASARAQAATLHMRRLCMMMVGARRRSADRALGR